MDNSKDVVINIKDPQQALNFLEHIAAQTTGTRDYHAGIQAAVNTIRVSLAAKEMKADKDDKLQGVPDNNS